MDEEKPDGRRLIKWLTHDPHSGSGQKIPELLRLTMIFIDRIGFPIFVTIALLGFSFYMVEKVLPVLTAIQSSLNEIVNLLRVLR